MARRWRWSLVALVVAAVVGTFMPSAVLSGAESVRGSVAVLITDQSPSLPTGCFAVSCGKGTPSAPTPVLSLAALAGLTVAALGLTELTRRRRHHERSVDSLPRGTLVPLFHPPQFS